MPKRGAKSSMVATKSKTGGRRGATGGGSAWPELIESRANEAFIEVIIGATGAGKTTYLMRELDINKPKRVLIWDDKGEFSDEGYAKPIKTIAAFVKAIREAGDGPMKLALIPYGKPSDMVKLYDLFCQAAYSAKRCIVIAEEMSNVCNGGSCNAAGWRMLITKGRTRGFRIYALTQRPALIDKTVLTQATSIRCGILGGESDAKPIANVMRGITTQELIDLQALEYIHYFKKGPVINRGKLTF